MMTPDEWDQAERDIVRAWTTGAMAEALQQIESVLRQGDDEQRGRALMYRGSIKQDAADWDAARGDFTQAVALFKQGSYPRYTAELSVGHAYERAGERQPAVRWYRAALLTCTQAEELFSGATATKAFLALEPVPTPKDMELARAVTVRSWQVLNLAGEPDLDDLGSATDTLIQRASTPDA